MSVKQELIIKIAGYLRNASEVTIILGAGASKSAGIPIASELVGLIRDTHSHCFVTQIEAENATYGIAMAALSPGERKALLKPFLDNPKVNWGHIALACLINRGNIQRILTFNFDLLVEKTTSMVGLHLPVYDFGVSPTNDITALATPAIVHLHGQSYGLKMLNSVAETQTHAKALAPLLGDSLRHHLTIITGYSGEADAAFEVIEREFNSHLPLIWLGLEPAPKPHLSKLLAKPNAHYIGGCDFDKTMIDLARKLGCFPPKIISNPPDHVLSMLTDVLPFPVTEQDKTDLLTDTRERLTSAAGNWISDGDNTAKAQAAVIQGTEPPPAGDLAKMDENEKTARAWAAVMAGNALADKAKTLTGQSQTAKFADAYENYAQAVQIKRDKHEAYYNWGIALSDEARTLTGPAQAAKFADACAKYDQAVQIKPDKHEAFNNWANALSDEARTLTGPAQAAKFAEARKKYAQAVQIKPDMHEAFNNWGNALSDEALTLTGPAQAAKFAEAREKLDMAKASYNFACVESLTGNLSLALDELEACHRDGTLPDRTHLETDTDMDPLRAEPRFQALLASL